MELNDAYLRSMEKYYKRFKGLGHMRFVNQDLLDAVQKLQDRAAVLSDFTQLDFSTIMENGALLKQIASNINFSEVLSYRNELLSSLAPTISKSVISKWKSNMDSLQDQFAGWEKKVTSDFADAFKRSVEKVNFEHPVRFNEIVDNVVEELAESHEVEKEAEEISKDITDEEISGEPITKKNIKDSIAFLIFLHFGPVILTFLLSLIVNKVSTSPAVIQDNSVQTVNNYYTKELGIEASLMNELSWRIVKSKEVKPRIKPDCSSHVVGRLKVGRVVCEVDKWKKWRKIMWQSKEGVYYSGWIQNYKLTKFKNGKEQSNIG